MGDAESESSSFDKSFVTELRVKQKYMGHRNARYNVGFRTVNLLNFNLVVANND